MSNGASGWDEYEERADYDTFQPGVFVNSGYQRTGSLIENLNFYTVGLTDLEVSVEFFYAGTDDPYEVKGHMTCIDLDVGQKFGFEAPSRSRRSSTRMTSCPSTRSKASSPRPNIHAAASRTSTAPSAQTRTTLSTSSAWWEPISTPPDRRRGPHRAFLRIVLERVLLDGAIVFRHDERVSHRTEPQRRHRRRRQARRA